METRMVVGWNALGEYRFTPWRGRWRACNGHKLVPSPLAGACGGTTRIADAEDRGPRTAEMPTKGFSPEQSANGLPGQAKSRPALSRGGKFSGRSRRAA